MPILIPQNYPAYKVLEKKNVFVMNSDRASIQDIRPLKIGVINLMPTLEITEEQLIKMLANTPLQVDLQLIMMDSDYHKKEDLSHLNQFYRPYREVKDEKFDGMIITGAPVEQMEFEEVDYWEELCEIMEWVKKNVGVYSVAEPCAHLLSEGNMIIEKQKFKGITFSAGRVNK